MFSKDIIGNFMSKICALVSYMFSYCTLKGTDDGVVYMAIPFCFISISDVLSAIKAVIKSPLNVAFIKQPFPCRNDVYFFPVNLYTFFFVIGYNQQVVATSD